MSSRMPFTEQPELTKEEEILSDVRRMVLSEMTLGKIYNKLRRYVHWLRKVTPNHPVSNLKLKKGKDSKTPLLLQFSCLGIGDVSVPLVGKPVVYQNGSYYLFETC